MTNHKHSKRFNGDFRKIVVDLYRSGPSVRELSSEYGVSKVTIYAWLKKFNPVKLEDGSSVTPNDYAKIQKNTQATTGKRNIKKSYDHIRKKVTDNDITDLIDQEKEYYPVHTLCQVLGVPRSTYYQSLKFFISKREQENQQQTKEIIRIFNDNKQHYGAPKIHHLLLEAGNHVSLKRVQCLMKKTNLRSIITKKFRPSSSKEKIIERENILERNFETKTINEKLVDDVTYIHTLKHGWCYLASILDLHTRKIVGYSFERKMTTELISTALQNAYETEPPQKDSSFIQTLAVSIQVMNSPT